MTDLLLDRQRQYRDFFGQLPTGVTVIVAHTPAGRRGLVVGTFASVSLNPPLVSFMVNTGSKSWAAVRTAGQFTANVLASDQRRLSQGLAGWSPDKFDDVAFEPEPAGALVLQGCLGWAECHIEREIDAGDHTIVLARPEQLTIARYSARPLVFYQGAYHRPMRIEDARAPGWS